MLVNSSDIYSVDYDENNHILTICFHSNWVYEYSNVPSSVYNRLITASSKGRFFHTYIKDKYPTKRIR